MAANPLWDMNEYTTRYVKDPQIEEWIRQGIIRRNDRGDWDIDFERLPTVAGTNYHINEDLGNGILVPAGGGVTKDPNAVYHDPYYGDMTSSANLDYPLGLMDYLGPLVPIGFGLAGAAGLLPTLGGEAAAGGVGLLGGAEGALAFPEAYQIANAGMAATPFVSAAEAAALPLAEAYQIASAGTAATPFVSAAASGLPSIAEIVRGLGTAASSGLLGGTPEGGGGAAGGGGGGLGGGSAGTSYMELLRRRYGLA